MLIKNVYIENAQETKDIRIRDGVFSEIAAGRRKRARRLSMRRGCWLCRRLLKAMSISIHA